jgi:hypothetical protein
MMNSQKVKFSAFPSFRRKPESSNINMFWMPPYQVRGRLIKSGMTVGGLFARPASMKIRKNFALNMLPFLHRPIQNKVDGLVEGRFFPAFAGRLHSDIRKSENSDTGRQEKKRVWRFRVFWIQIVFFEGRNGSAFMDGPVSCWTQADWQPSRNDRRSLK